MLDRVTRPPTRRTATWPLFGIRCALGRLTPLVSQAEEPRAVPVCAGDQAGDLGEAAVGLSVISIAPLNHDHPVDDSFPFTDELGAGLDLALAQGRQHRCGIRCIRK